MPTAISDPTGGLGPGGAGGFAGVSSSISGAVSNSPISAASFGGATSALQGADFGSFTKDISGKITGLSGELQAKLPGAVAEFQNKLPGAVAEFNKVLPQAQDQLKTVLNSPAINKFPITDMVKQVNTGFSVGALDSIDTTALNAAVVNQAGSLNNPAFIDSATKSIGKFGVNVDQLKKQGFVRPEAVFNDQLADPSVWTGKGGATSRNKFLSNSGLQESVQQAVTADDYQTMVNSGAIKFTDGKEEIIGMLTASNTASPEVVKQVREGFSNIEGVLQNTTNIPGGADIASVVKQNMQVGAAAAKRANQIKSDQAKREVEQSGSLVSEKAAAQPNSFVTNAEAAQKHLEMFSKQAQLSPEQQKQLNESILQIYAGVDKANPAE